MVLVPYGMSGVLTGHSYKASHQQAQKVINEWKHFYPVVPEEIKKEPSSGEDGNEEQPKEEKEKEPPPLHWGQDLGEDALPAVVEVMVGKYRQMLIDLFLIVELLMRSIYNNIMKS